MTFTSMALVAFGSTIGGLARFSFGQAIAKVNQGSFPWGTWLINMIGALLLGVFTQEFIVLHHDPHWSLLLGTGFCGGFTTFSTMSVESVRLFRTSRMHGFVYLGSSFVIGLVLAWIPQWLM